MKIGDLFMIFTIIVAITAIFLYDLIMSTLGHDKMSKLKRDRAKLEGGGR